MEFGSEYNNKKNPPNLNYNFQDFYATKISIMSIYVQFICADYTHVYMYAILTPMFNTEVVQHLVVLIDNQEHV